MEVINLSLYDSAIHASLEELRTVGVQDDRARFRHNLRRLGWYTAYELSRRLGYENRSIATPLSPATVRHLQDNVVLATIFRAGLPFHQGFLDVFDRADSAFVSAFRYYKDKDSKEVGVHIEYIASPALDGKTLVIADPMLATGGSFELGLSAFETKGRPAKVHLCSVIAAPEGVEHLKQVYAHDDRVTLWCCAIDDHLNEHKYIVPGLGDAGDLCYGDKI